MDIRVANNKRTKGRTGTGTGLYAGANGIVSGRDWALQNEIDETKKRTQARGCFRGCFTCGACANSKRDNFSPQALKTASGLTIVKNPTESYDSVNKEWVDCRGCEPFRFHDCHNGVMRNTRQEAEPFTEEQENLLRKTGGKPLI